MLFLMEVRKIYDFYQRGRERIKGGAAIGMNNEVNFRFYRYLHNTVINNKFLKHFEHFEDIKNFQKPIFGSTAVNRLKT